MAIERKCPNCNTWNNANDFCTNCNAAISPHQIALERVQKIEKQEKEKPVSNVDVFLKKIKSSSNPLVKITYYILASVWAVYMLLLGIILYIAAATPG